MRSLTRHFRLLPYAFLIVWVIAVIAVFYAFHSYKMVPPVAALIRLGRELLTVAVICTIATAWGRLVMRWARIHSKSHLESLVFGTAIGHGIIATIMLVLGLMGWLRSPVVRATTMALALVALPEVWCLVREWARAAQSANWPPRTTWDFGTFLRFCLGASLLLGLLMASLPPTSWDALIVHLVIPREALAQGRLALDSQRVPAMSGRPILQHMLYAWGMALGGDVVPKLIHFSFALFTLLAVYAITRTYLHCSPLLAAALFYMTPVVQLVASWAYVDVGVTFYTVITLYALLNWMHRQEAQWVLLAGLLSVWSAQVKNNGWFIVLFATVFVVCGLLRSESSWQRRLRVFVLFCLVGVLASIPWLVLNLWNSQQVLPQASQAASRASSIPQEGTWFRDAARNGLNLLVLPWRMTMKGAQGRYDFDGEIGPLFLLFLPLWVLIWREERAVKALVLCAAAEFLLWLVWFSGGRLQNRLLMPIFPFLAMLTARTLAKLKEFTIRSFSPYHFTRLVIAGVLLLTLFSQVRYVSAFSPGSFIFGVRDRDEYLSYVLDHLYVSAPHYYGAMKQIEHSLAPSDMVGMLRPEKRVYYVPRSYVADPMPLHSSAEDMWEASRRLGLTHLLVSRSSLEFQLHQSGDPRLDRRAIAAYVDHLAVFLREHGRLLEDECADYELYALRES
jgi:hypothetical protein